MARNEEKSHSMLNRWLDFQKDEATPGRSSRRPGMTSNVATVDECEKWRGQVLKEIGRKVMQIQNAGLPERTVRDVNDEINKLLREKNRWERRILDLGGPNYFASGNRARAEEGGGVSVGGGKGDYKYFGEAKNLPEVKELFRRQEEHRTLSRQEKRPHELHKGLDADYYGMRDDDDGLLAPLEAAAEAKARNRALKEWKKAREGSSEQSEAAELAELAALEPDLRSASSATAMEVEGSAQLEGLAAPRALPSKEEIEASLLEKRKEELLRRYAHADSISFLAAHSDAQAQTVLEQLQ